MGIEENIFCHPNDIPVTLYCPVCLNIVLGPVVSKCGHLSCTDCMEQYLKHSNKCPKCRCDIDEKSLLFSKETQKQVSAFEVFCDPEPFKRCGWTGPYSELRKHLKKCPTISLEVPDKKFSINISSNEPDIDEIAKLNVEDIEKMSTKKLLKFSKDFGVSSENVLEKKEMVDKFIDSVYIPEMAKNFDMEHIPTKYLMRFLKLRKISLNGCLEKKDVMELVRLHRNEKKNLQ